MNQSNAVSYLNMDHGGNKLRFCRYFNVDPEKAVDFSASINPLGFPPGLDKYLAERIHLIQDYPDVEFTNLRRILSGYLAIPGESILPGNGSMELIDLALRMIKPKAVAIAQPNFNEYERISKSLGAKVLPFPELQKADVLIYSNPNNPTGHLTQGRDREAIVQFSKKRKKWLIVDEAFIEFAGEEHSLAKEVINHERLIVIRSATKFFALPGLRLGYAAAHPGIIKKLAAIQVPWSVNVLAEEAMEYCVKDLEFQKNACAFIKSEREWFSRELGKTGWFKVHPSAANFLLCEITLEPVLLDSFQIFNDLGRQGIFVRFCSTFTGLDTKFFRIAVKTREENERLLAAL